MAQIGKVANSIHIIIATTLLALTIARSSHAQNPNAQQPIGVSGDITTERAGINENQKEYMTLRDAIAQALEKNLTIEYARVGVEVAQHNLFSARGFYNITSSADTSYRTETFPVASIFGGGNTSSSVTLGTVGYNFATTKQVQMTGGNWRIDFNNDRVNTSSTAERLTTQYTPSLTFSFTQPLRRNFSIDQNRRQIQVFSRQLAISDSEFRQRVIEIINLVQRVYWDLVFAIRLEQISRETVELTKTLLENNNKMVEAGVMAGIELRSTEATLESRKGNLILSLQNVSTAENALKVLLVTDPQDKLWYSQIIPTDDPRFDQVGFNLEEATSLALKNRPELEQLRLQEEQRKIDVKFFKNQTRPQVDLVGVVTNRGLAGSPSTLVTGNGGLDSFTQSVLNNINETRTLLGLAPIIVRPDPPVPLGNSVPERFRGGYGRSLGNLFSQDFRTMQVGVRISLPWRNQTAEADLGRTMAEAKLLDIRRRQISLSIQVEVRNIWQSVMAAKRRFEVAQAARSAAEAQLNGETKRFLVGLSTNFFVLQRQTDLSIAKVEEVRALTDYNKAASDLQRVIGPTITR